MPASEGEMTTTKSPISKRLDPSGIWVCAPRVMPAIRMFFFTRMSRSILPVCRVLSVTRNSDASTAPSAMECTVMAAPA